MPDRAAGATACDSTSSSSSACSQTVLVGSRVQVLPSVTSPLYGWGSVTYSSVGTVTFVQGNNVTVNFPEQSGWIAAARELQVVCNSLDCGAGFYISVAGCTSCPAGMDASCQRGAQSTLM